VTSLRLAGCGGLTFLLLFVIHRVLQGIGPRSGDDLVAYYVGHRGAQQASEVAVGLALVAFIVFLAALVPALWRVGAQFAAVATVVSGTAFVATSLLSNAAETALIAVANGGANGADTTGTVALYQLQGRTPIVLTIAAFAASMAIALRRTGLLWPWFAWASWFAAAIFLLGFVFSTLGDTPEGPSSLYGVAVFVLWMLVLSLGLVRAPMPPRSSGAAPA
jgi:hypothetical protein